MAKTRKQATSQKELTGLVTKWRKRLRLMDWNVTANFDNDGILKEKGVWGACLPQGAIREAGMLFRNPVDATADHPLFDLETIVVHELLHIFFAPLNHESYAEITVEEQMVHTVSILLVALERQGKKVGRAMCFDSVEINVGNAVSCAPRIASKKNANKESR
jgi:hypothetical protein